MTNLIAGILYIIKGQRLDLTHEKTTQEQLHNVLTKNGYPFVREYRLDQNNIPDLFFNGIAIEVKIKGSKKGIFRQCVRYCEFDQVKVLILCSNKSMGIPGEILGKPVYFVNLSKAWL